jgi:hypothetical protein
VARRSLPQIGVQVAHDHVRQRVVSILDEQRRRVVRVLAERSARTQAHAARCSQIAISDGCGARLAAAAHSSMCSPNLGETTKNCAAPAAAAACAILSNTCRRDPWAGGRAGGRAGVTSRRAASCGDRCMAAAHRGACRLSAGLSLARRSRGWATLSGHKGYSRAV